MTSKAATLAAQWWADRLQQGDKDKFKTFLAEAIDREITAYGHSYTDCDYDPQGILLEALRAAGVECQGCMMSAEGILPMKHSLRAMPDCLEPKEGYGNWTEVIKVDE
jgi:hypothetical protein